MKEIRLLILSNDCAFIGKLRSLLCAASGLPYTVVCKTTKDEIHQALDAFPAEVVIADMAHNDGASLLNDLKSEEFNGGLVAVFEAEEEITTTAIARCPVQDTLLKTSLDPLLVRHVLRFARQRRQSQLLLAREQALFSELLNNTPDRIYFKDRHSRFIRVNMGMAIAFGYKDPEELRGKSDFDIHPHERAEDAFNDEQKILQTGDPLVDKDETERHADGTIHWVNTLKMPLKNPRGQIIGTMGISRDITNEKNIELALHREKKLLSTILEVLPDNLFVKDCKGRYILSNTAQVKELGLENEQQVLGKTVFDLFPADIAQRLNEQDSRVLSSNETVFNVEEFRPGNADHPDRWLLISKVPLKDPISNDNLLVGIARDISEQKQTQSKLENVIIELQKTQSELIEAEKLKIVGRLAAGVAHEVKNPLNIILMAADTLCEEGIEEDERQELCQEIRKAVQKANNVIFELLDFSAARELQLDYHSLNEVVLKSIGLVRHRVLKSKVSMHTDLDETLPDIPLDPQKMEQVLINLIFNAVNAMPEGGRIDIKTRIEMIGNEADVAKGLLIERFRIGDKSITLSVSDTGVGIDKDNLSKVFEPFFTTGPNGKSSGLGLMVTKNIVERHHGVLTLRNRQHGGIEAKIYLHTKTINPNPKNHDPSPHPRKLQTRSDC
jgi:PAS domain S-box-containing protein